MREAVQGVKSNYANITDLESKTFTQSTGRP
jgi:hypothetical protein